MNSLVHVEHLHKTYQTGEVAFSALKGVSLEICSGEFVAIMGHSGSGKSTLLHLIGGLDRPNSGSVIVGHARLESMSETELAKFRRSHIGFIFQFFNLIENLTIQANVELPGLLNGHKDKVSVRTRAAHLLDRLGISDQSNKHPWELSGGQQQRAAIARSLINNPLLLLADEPTGNLDSRSGQAVLEILDEFHSQGQTILMVTHDPSAAARADRVLFIHDGVLADCLPGGDARLIAEMHLADLN